MLIGVTVIFVMPYIHGVYLSNTVLSSYEILRFTKDVKKLWNFEDITLFDSFDQDNDEPKIAAILEFVGSNQGISARFTTEEHVDKFLIRRILNDAHRAVVIFNSDDSGYFSTLSSQHLASVTWFAPATMDISNLSLRLDSNLYLYTKLENESFLLHEAYSIKGGPLIINQVGSWDPFNGLQISEPSPWERRKNLSGITIRNSILTSHGYPVIVAIQGKNNTIDVTGYFPEILNLLSFIMGFKVLHVIPPDGNFGSQNKDGTWNGVVGMLQNNQADTSTAGLTISLERQEAIDFAMPLMEEPITFLLMNPSSKGTVNIWAYLKTFTIEAWIVSIVTFIILILVMSFHGRFGTEDFQEKSRFSLTASIGFMFIALLQRDKYFPHSKNSTHMLILVATMFYYLIFTYFGTALTSFLTVLEPAKQIKSFQDILKYDYHMITLKGSVIETFLKGAKPPSVFYDIYSKDMKGRQSAFLSSFPDVIKALQDDPKTGLFGPATVTYLINGLVELKLPESLSSYSSLGLQYNSEFRKMFDHHLLKMSQSGIMDKVYNKWFNATTSAYEVSEGSDIIVLTYDNLIFPFLILTVGAALAVVLTLVEALIKNIIVRQINF